MPMESLRAGFYSDAEFSHGRPLDAYFSSSSSRPQVFFIPQRRGRLIELPYNRLSLFSGGLDSLIGAINDLTRGLSPLLISHIGDAAASLAQHHCFKSLKEHYRGSTFNRVHANFRIPTFSATKRESTTRGRSFLFFSLGVAAGTGLYSDFTLIVPENGLIAINAPLDPLRLGASSTRTTHPFYIARWNEVLKTIGVRGTVENLYWSQTKGEMVRDSLDMQLLNDIVADTLSCSAPSKARFIKGSTPFQNCGYCLPRLIRRGALHAGMENNLDPTTYTVANPEIPPWKSQEGKFIQIRSFQFALEKMFKTPPIANLVIHKAGPLNDLSQSQQKTIARVYEAGMSEVAALFTTLRVRHYD